MLTAQPHITQCSGANIWLFPSTVSQLRVETQGPEGWVSFLLYCPLGCSFASSAVEKLSFEGYSEDASSSEAGGWQVSGQPG